MKIKLYSYQKLTLNKTTNLQTSLAVELRLRGNPLQQQAFLL